MTNDSVVLRRLVKKLAMGCRLAVEEDAMWIPENPSWGAALTPDEARVLRQVVEEG